MIGSIVARLRDFRDRIASPRVRELEEQVAHMSALLDGRYHDLRLVRAGPHHGKDAGFEILFRSNFGRILAEFMVQSLASVGAKNYVEIGATHNELGPMTFTIQRVCGETPGTKAERLSNLLSKHEEPQPADKWHEDDGPVLWWSFPLSEPPYLGTPLDLGQTVEVTVKAHGVDKLMRVQVGGWPGYHTHWTPLLTPAAPEPTP